MSDYYGDAILEDWLYEEVFLASQGPLPKEVVQLFEKWRVGVERQINLWLESDDGDGNRLSWRGWGRGFYAIPETDKTEFEAAIKKGLEILGKNQVLKKAPATIPSNCKEDENYRDADT